jgi:hypothetical protein
VEVQTMRLSAEGKRALSVLAGSPTGCTEAIMLAHGFAVTLLARLVIDGLASAKSEAVHANGRSIKVIRMRITAEGRRRSGSLLG